MYNQDNEWIQYLEQGKEAPKAVQPRKGINTQEALRAKYPNTPLPSHRVMKTVSDKQRKAINRGV